MRMIRRGSQLVAVAFAAAYVAALVIGVIQWLASR